MHKKNKIFENATSRVCLIFDKMGVFEVLFWCAPEKTIFLGGFGATRQKNKQNTKMRHSHVSPFWRFWMRPSAHPFSCFF